MKKAINKFLLWGDKKTKLYVVTDFPADWAEKLEYVKIGVMKVYSEDVERVIINNMAEGGGRANLSEGAIKHLIHKKHITVNE